MSQSHAPMRYTLFSHDNCPLLPHIKPFCYNRISSSSFMNTLCQTQKVNLLASPSVLITRQFQTMQLPQMVSKCKPHSHSSHNLAALATKPESGHRKKDKVTADQSVKRSSNIPRSQSADFLTLPKKLNCRKGSLFKQQTF